MSLFIHRNLSNPVRDLSERSFVNGFMACVEWGVKEGLLRHLDLALIRFFHSLQVHLPEEHLFPLLWIIAILSKYQSQGHSCVSLRGIIAKEIDLFDEYYIQKSDFLSHHYAELRAHLPKNQQAWMDALEASHLVKTLVSDVGIDVGPDFMPASTQESLDRSDHRSLKSASIVVWSVERDVLIYFKRQWLAEDFTAKALHQKSNVDFDVDPSSIKTVLRLLFPDSLSKESTQAVQSQKGRSSAKEDFDWQKIACALSVKSSLTVVTGGPGTGKTYTVARLIALASMLHQGDKPLRIALAAPTGKAASRLFQSIESSLLSLSSSLVGHLDAHALIDSMGSAKTLHTLLGYQMQERKFRFHEKRHLSVDLLVLDEASMVDGELMCALLKALHPQARLILLGDKDQLSSVEAGAVLAELSGQIFPSRIHVLGDLYEPSQVDYLCQVLGLSLEKQLNSHAHLDTPCKNVVMLQKSRRFEGHIAELAQAINLGDLENVSRVLIKSRSQDINCTSSVKMDPLLDLCLSSEKSVLEMGQSADLFEPDHKPNFLNYLKLLRRCGALSHDANHGKLPENSDWILDALTEFERFRVLCAINEGPLGSAAINVAIEKRLQKENWIKVDSEWYSGRAIMLTRNQHDLGLSNGDVGLVLSDTSEHGAGRNLRAYFLSGNGFQSVSINRLLSVQTAYAMSIHKSQGSEYEHALVVLQDHAEKSLTRELLYTGVTRAKKYLSLYQAQPGLIEQAVSVRAKRISGLARRMKQLAELDKNSP